MLRDNPPAVSRLTTRSIPQDEVEQLSSGAFFHRINGGDQPVCRLQLFFFGGQAETGNDLISRIALGGITEGCSKATATEIADIMDFHGIRMNSSCHDHYTSLTLSALSERLADFLPLLSEMLASPTYPADRITTRLASAKVQVETSRHEIFTLADEAFSKLMMGSDHPLAYAIKPSDIDSYRPDCLADVHSRLMAPDRAHFFLSGLYDDRLVESVRDFCNSLPTHGQGYERISKPHRPEPAGTRVEVPFAESLQSALAAGLPTIGRENRDYNDLRLAVMALGGYFGSRLMSNIREDKGLTYGISAALFGTPEGSYIKIAAQCDRKYTERVIEEIRLELLKLASDPPKGEELERLRMHAFTALIQTLDTPWSTMGYYISRLLAGTPPGYFEAQQRDIIALTPERIAVIAGRYLNPGNLRFVVTGI